MKEYDNLRRVVGQIIQLQRANKGWTQQQLANATSLKRTTVSNIEAGRQALTLEQFCLIADVLDIKAGDTLQTALQRLIVNDRWNTVESVVSAHKIKERNLRQHVLDTLKLPEEL